MLGTYARVVEPRGDALGAPHLAVLVLEDVGEHAVEDPLPPLDQGGGVLPRAGPARLDPESLTPLSRTKAWKLPMELLPPPTQATTASGRRPFLLKSALTSRPITLWKSLTMTG